MELRELRDAAEDHRNEMEAVEILASLARRSALRGGGSGSESSCRKLVKESTAVISSPRSSQDRAIANCLGNASSMAEKEARRLHRVLANRESARLTIRRRQAMHQELIRKAADLLEENENLKKEKDLAMKEYNSLKGRNEFLKLQIKKAEPGETQEKKQKSCDSETATSATNSSPIFLHNQPSLPPFFWPFVPSSNAILLQYASHADNMTSSQFPTCHKDISSWHLGPGNPLLVLPVPWLLPFSDYSRTLHSHSQTDQRQNETPSTHLCSVSSSSDTPIVEDNHDLFPYLVSEKLNSITPTSVTESQNLPKKNPEYQACEDSQNVFAATKARRRRMELMRLKNIHCLHARTTEQTVEFPQLRSGKFQKNRV